MARNSAPSFEAASAKEPVLHHEPILHHEPPEVAHRRRVYAVPALFVALLVAIAIGCGEAPNDQEYLTDLRCTACRTIDVERVIDGDTIETPDGIVRLFGIDTPEAGEACATEATYALGRLLDGTARVQTALRHRDSHGRLLYYLFTPAGNSIEEMLVARGLAEAWTKDGQHRDFLVGVEVKTRLAKRGCLWER